MNIFRLNKYYSIVCEYKSTSRGFNHYATLFKCGREIEWTKICYLNRTWERFCYESVILKVLDNSDLTDKEKKRFKNLINKKWGY